MRIRHPIHQRRVTVAFWPAVEGVDLGRQLLKVQTSAHFDLAGPLHCSICTVLSRRLNGRRRGCRQVVNVPRMGVEQSVNGLVFVVEIAAHHIQTTG